MYILPGLKTSKTGQPEVSNLRVHDRIQLVSDASASLTVTLPPVAESAGKEIVIKKSNSSSNTITVSPNEASGVTIDGQSSVVIYTQYEVGRFWCDGSNWYIW